LRSSRMFPSQERSEQSLKRVGRNWPGKFTIAGLVRVRYNAGNRQRRFIHASLDAFFGVPSRFGCLERL
jgi:hypothetical protein